MTAGTYTSTITTNLLGGPLDSGITPAVSFTGTLTLTSPGSLAWAATLTGSNQNAVDTVTANQQFSLSDQSGAGAGWHITVSGTTFTTGSFTLPNSGTFVLQRLKVTVSRGVTAANSGSAYEGLTGHCQGPSCWVKKLPGTVTLAPGERKMFAFRVAVPRWTRPGQYLVGITAESAIRPRSVVVGSNGRAQARAIIIDEVTVGVAVTVGERSRLRTALAISPVTAGWIGSTPRLYIPVDNPGQTFVRATGRIVCSSGGQRHSYQVFMSTVLPRGGAVLPVNAPGLVSGAVQCAIWLNDGTGRPVTWSGAVNVPPRRRRLAHPGRAARNRRARVPARRPLGMPRKRTVT